MPSSTVQAHSSTTLLLCSRNQPNIALLAFSLVLLQSQLVDWRAVACMPACRQTQWWQRDTACLPISTMRRTCCQGTCRSPPACSTWTCRHPSLCGMKTTAAGCAAPPAPLPRPVPVPHTQQHSRAPSPAARRCMCIDPLHGSAIVSHYSASHVRDHCG